MNVGLEKCFAVAFWVTGLALLLSMGVAAEPLRAALVKDGCPESDLSFVKQLASQLGEARYDVIPITFDELCDSARLSPDEFALLVLPDASKLPVRSVESIHGYLKGGGDIIALRAPLWQHALLRDGEEWLGREAFREKHAADLLHHTLFGFDAAEVITGWHRSTNDTSRVTYHEVVSCTDPLVQHALHVTIPTLDNWDTFVSPALEAPFPEGHDLTVFYAKGGPRTPELSIEWGEKDGSRWIATVSLAHEWRQYVLEAKDFRFWESVPVRAGTCFNPTNAAYVSVGLSFSHTSCQGGRHEYWVGPFGTAKRTPLHEKMLTSFTLPPLDTLSPGYKFYEAQDVAHLWLSGKRDTALPAAKTVRCMHPRPTAGGFDKGRGWRWAPIIEAVGTAGEWRGAAATLMAHADGPYKGGVWVSFGVADPEWYRAPAVLGIIGHLAQRLHRGVFIIDSGTQYYTYFEGQDVACGLRVVNLGPEAQEGLRAEVWLREPDVTRLAHEETWSLNLMGDESKRVARPVQLKDWPRKGYRALARVTAGGEVLDSAEHEVQVWRPKPEPSYITVENGDFMLDGQRWRPHGVNYMPSSGIGVEWGEYFEYWVGAEAYDPRVIQRDLERVKGLGFNAVSIFIHHPSLESQNLLDLLRRLDQLGLKANLSLRPGTPMDFQWEKMKDLIERYRIPEHDCVFALDLAWEPMFRDHDARKQWDPEWRAWIIERYGSIETAERDWGFPAPRDADGAVTNPLGEHTVGDGAWRGMVAAYRRFLDTLLYEKYSRARRLVRGLDPHHLVSFRMSEAGNPTFRWAKAIPYDFPYLAAAVDILEPEAYGRIGDWERVKPGCFEFEYARWAAPHLPMMWAEAGVHAWVQSQMCSTPERLQFQADYYTHLYRMFINSGADGIFFWWYPGGYRANERSDYGIINPDGSYRPVSKVIRAHAEALIHGPDAKPADHWIEIDRDAHPDGVGGIYDAAKEAFWEAIEDGHTPGLRTAGTGTDSSNCPLLAVGNTPYNGSNPPKYLDGFFDVVEVGDASGDWAAVERGGEVRVAPGAPVVARITLTNLGEARWLARGAGARDGAVSVLALGPQELRTPLPKDLPRFGSMMLDGVTLLTGAPKEPSEVTLTLEAKGRARFGPRYPVRIVSAK